jgi:hypothetical protein
MLGQIEVFLACVKGDPMRATMPQTLAREEVVLVIAIQLTKKFQFVLFVNPEEQTKKIRCVGIVVVKKFECRITLQTIQN